MKRPCLPRCFDPVHPDECYSRRRICCIEWTAGDGNRARFDVAENLLYPANIPDEENFNIHDWQCYCLRSHHGAVGVFGWEPKIETDPENVTVWSRYDDYVLLSLGVVETFKGTCASTAVWPVSGLVVEDHFARDLITWDGDNHDFPAYFADYPYFPHGRTWANLVENAEANFLFVSPGLRWFCTGTGPAAKITFQACWHIAYLSLDGPDEGTLWAIFAPYAQGQTGVNWWFGDPAPSIPLTHLWDGAPDSEVFPQFCNFDVCGEPTDCLPECISGTEDCNGQTPAHAPLFLTISAAEDCCLTGTFTLTYNEGSHRYRILPEASPSCSVESDCVGPELLPVSLGAEAYCAAPNAGPPDSWVQDDSGIILLHIWLTNGCGEREDHYVIVYLTCDSGGLVEATGEIETDTFCGDNSTNSFDWTLSA